METPVVVSKSRLRVFRSSASTTATDSTPVAGPSHLAADAHETREDDDDAQSTPRLPPSSIPGNPSPPHPTTANEFTDHTGAARLRAILARVPNNNTPKPSASAVPPTSSDADSDFDFPSTNATKSIARESLRELFSKALASPGKTPNRGKARRNSIDVSDVDGSFERVEEERAKNKGKRRSMSDEEDVPKLAQMSVRHSTASAFDALRARLGRSILPPTPPPEPRVDDEGMSSAGEDQSEDTATILRNLDQDSTSTNPITGSPMRTVQMSEQLHSSQSNLLEQESEMRQALGGIESAGLSPPPSRPVSFPNTRISPRASGSTRPLSWHSHSMSHSIHQIPLGKRIIEDLDNASSYAGSVQSVSDHKDRMLDVERDRLRERERMWNQPKPKTSPSHRSVAGPVSPNSRLSRRSSIVSLRSDNEDGRSSRASSIVSHTDLRERLEDSKLEVKKERERMWNRPPNARLPSSFGANGTAGRVRTVSGSSAQSMTESPVRVRTVSGPSRAVSSQSLHQQRSPTSLSNSSRASSPAGSISNISIEATIPEVQQEHERDWNSTQPKWIQTTSMQRSASPMPQSLSTSPGTGLRRHQSMPKSPEQISPRPRKLSTRAERPVTMHMDTTGMTAASKMNGSVSPLANGSAREASASPSPQPRSAILLNGESSTNQTPGYRSRFGWHFPPNRTPLPPLEFESPPKAQPPSSSSSRLTTQGGSSNIPVRSPGKRDKENTSVQSQDSQNPSEEGDKGRRRGHRRSFTEFAESAGRVPPMINQPEPEPEPETEPEPDTEPEVQTEPETEKEKEQEPASESEPQSEAESEPQTVTPHNDLPPQDRSRDDSLFASDVESLPANSTPTTRRLALPETSADRFSPPPPPSPTTITNTNGDVLKVDESMSRPDSPPPSPPRAQAPSDSLLQTPPRSFSRQVLETPSPPKNMPDLPGPPSSEDEIEGTPTRIRVDSANLTAMKTPRPPGAWLQTPVPVPADPFARAQSTPLENMATPVAAGQHFKALSRATSMPLPTPAPPGAWMPTPAGNMSARRRSILKVRFDVDNSVENTSVEGTFEHVSAQADGPVAPQVAIRDGEQRKEVLQERPSTPPTITLRNARRSPGVRLVDAFGRETDDTTPPAELKKEEGSAAVKTARPSTPPLTGPVLSGTPRNQSVVKIVDAMGREVPEISEETPSFMRGPLTRQDALARLQRVANEIAGEISEIDKSSDELGFNGKLVELEEASRAARTTRKKILESLEMVKDVEEDGKNQLARLQALSRGKLFAPVFGEQRRTWSSRIFWSFIVLQLILILIYYRMSTFQARRHFLTTYYDPFSPDLYLHVTKPDTTCYTIPSPCLSSFDLAELKGWRDASTALWTTASCTMSRWQRLAWDVWSAGSQQSQGSAWPPT